MGSWALVQLGTFGRRPNYELLGVGPTTNFWASAQLRTWRAEAQLRTWRAEAQLRTWRAEAQLRTW
ncbi:MAG: hypothetical protein MUC60_18690, partial [Oscillatoria sp. Prado101]|nr:hypothetical protein [Oscillatoria sp. Prado101]